MFVCINYLTSIWLTYHAVLGRRKIQTSLEGDIRNAFRTLSNIYEQDLHHEIYIGRAQVKLVTLYNQTSHNNVQQHAGPSAVGTPNFYALLLHKVTLYIAVGLPNTLNLLSLKIFGDAPRPPPTPGVNEGAFLRK